MYYIFVVLYGYFIIGYLYCLFRTYKKKKEFKKGTALRLTIILAIGIVILTLWGISRNFDLPFWALK